MESVENCLADPDKFDCISRSYPTSSRFNIHIEPLPSQTSTIYIKITGPRCDHRARSASPISRHGQVVAQYEDTRPMPPFITVWGMPEMNRWNGRIDWRATIVFGEEPAEMEWRQAVNETRNEPTLVERIELSRRNPEKSVSYSSPVSPGGQLTCRSFPSSVISSLRSLTLYLQGPLIMVGLSLSQVNEMGRD